MKLKVQSISWNKELSQMTVSYPKIGREIVVTRTSLRPSIRDYSEVHGLTQRFGDLESGDKTGEAKFQAATKLLDQYQTSDEWSMQTERDTLSELIAAVHKVTPQFSEEQLAEAAAAAPDQVQDWREDSRVRLELAKARVAKANARVKAEKPKDLVIKGLK